MRKQIIQEERRCPKCGEAQNQVSAGYNRSRTQRCICRNCKIYYTLNPKPHEYSVEIKQTALHIHYSGVSGRGVGKLLNMSKANVYNWIKRPGGNENKPKD